MSLKTSINLIFFSKFLLIGISFLYPLLLSFYMDIITPEKLEKYFSVTGEALKKVKIAPIKDIDWEEKAKDFLDMAQRYYSDAKHFAKKGDVVTAFAARNYAHGWLDAGARLGLFDVDHDSRLFTID